MKLLLTSNGICNESLKKALYDLAQREEISTVFITNASNKLNMDKNWLVDDLYRFRTIGEIDLLDLVSTPKEVPKGLNYVNFHFRPHLNSPHFPQAREEVLEKIAQQYPNEKIYACDDNSGIKIDGNSFDIVGEGEYLEFN